MFNEGNARKFEEIVDVEAYVTDRISLLGKKAMKERGLCDFSKMYGGVLAAASYFSAMSIPGGQIITATSLMGYIIAVYGDYASTGKFRMLPSRRTLGGLSKDEESDETDFVSLNKDYEEDISYLNQREQIEAKFINIYFDELCEELEQLPISGRAKKYQQVIDSIYSRKKQSKYYQYFEARRCHNLKFVEAEIESMNNRPIKRVREIENDYLTPEKQRELFLEGTEQRCDESPVVSVNTAEENPPRYGFTGYQSMAKEWHHCTFTIAGQGTGKTELYYWLSLLLTKKGVRVFYLNLASKRQDKGRVWENHSTCVRADLRKIVNPQQAKAVIKEAFELLQEYDACEEDKFLIIDEANVTFLKKHNYAKEQSEFRSYLIAMIGDLISTGGKGRQSIHALNQGLKAGTMVQDLLPLFKSMRLNYMTIAPGEKVYAEDRDQWITHDDQTRRDIVNNFEKECSKPPMGLGDPRIMQFNGIWYPTGSKADLGFSEEGSKLSTPVDLSAQKKTSKIDQLLKDLDDTGSPDLWTFSEKQSPPLPTSDLKRRFIEILSTRLEQDNTELANKYSKNRGEEFFKYDGRYSYPSREEKEYETRLLTDFRCCLCQKRTEDIEVHRLSYLGEEDQVGDNMVPLCEGCHDEAHEASNWNLDLESIWGSSQIESFTRRVKLGLNYLTKNVQD
ncbi:MAG: HNH endonuclease [Moorea sp. SIO4A3]|nr:HNH endonuclease [Moorena sp. SIO4A3]